MPSIRLRRSAALLLSTAALAAAAPSHASGQNLEDKAANSGVADAATTAGALLLGGAELNPLGPVVVLAKAPLMAHVKSLPDVDRAGAFASFDAIWGGAAANNTCIMAALATGGALAAACPLVGAVWGWHRWDQSATEREFWEICRREREHWNNPDMKCEYTPPAPAPPEPASVRAEKGVSLLP